MYKTVVAPKESFKCTHFLEFYKLKPGCRLFIEDNLELRIGLEYYIYSEKEKGWYRREFTGHLAPSELFLDILLGNIRLVYTLEEINVIKAYNKRNGLKNYGEYMRKMISEYKQSRIEGRKRYTEDWETKSKIYRNYKNQTT